MVTPEKYEACLKENVSFNYRFIIDIEKADNGYVASWVEEGEEENYYITHKLLFEDKEDDELDSMLKLLYFIKEHFGVNYSKHQKRNINIEIKENEL